MVVVDVPGALAGFVGWWDPAFLGRWGPGRADLRFRRESGRWEALGRAAAKSVGVSIGGNILTPGHLPIHVSGVPGF